MLQYVYWVSNNLLSEKPERGEEYYYCLGCLALGFCFLKYDFASETVGIM